MRKSILFLALSGFVLLHACKKEPAPTTTGKKVSLDLPDSVDIYYTSSRDAQANANEKATLGRVLFYDKHLSVNNSVSCASCHKQAYAFADNERFSHGFENRLTTRNSMPIQNLLGSQKTPGETLPGPPSNNQLLFWDGRVDNVFGVVSNPVRNHIEMAIDDPNSLPGKIAGLPYYPALFKAAYGSEDITFDRMNEAIVYFMCAIRSNNTRWDLYQRTQSGLSALELNGSALFLTKYNCAQCHNTGPDPFYSNASFMDIGLDNNYVDKGMGARTNVQADMGRFRIPGLRNVAMTAPYMHDGRFKTLEDVLDHYSQGINNSPNLDDRLKSNGAPIRMSISPEDKGAIIAFLKTLTDYSMLTDSRFSDPFKIK